MARIARNRLEGTMFHLTLRGINRAPVFLERADYQKWIIRQQDVRRRWTVHAWCLMPNHVHYVVTADVEAIADAMRLVSGAYAQWFNRKHGRTGPLFESRYKATPIADEAHLHRSVVYVLMNPVRAGLCRHPAEWPWSSYREAIADEHIRLAMLDAARSAQGTVPFGDSPRS